MTEERTCKVLDMPRSSAHCEIGPQVEYRPFLARVRYDSEAMDYTAGEAGASELLPVGKDRDWTTVSFLGAIAIRFTPEEAATPLMVEAYNCVVEVENSMWLSSVRQQFQHAFHELSQSKRHFMIFFDHHGCLEVIADTVEVNCD